MSRTPRSSTPSRAGTPARLHPPVLHPVPSLSSFRVYSHGSSSNSISHTPASTSPSDPSTPVRTYGGVDSSASSTMGTQIDAPDGILMQEPDADVDVVDGEQGSASGTMETHAGKDESKKNLREQLRRTLNDTDLTSHKGKAIEFNEISHTPIDVYQPRQYFVLTDAGKPVFISQTDNADSFTSTMAIIQAIISVFLDDDDKLRCINAGSTRITFLLRSPLYYVSVSSWGEPESVTRFHLEYLHLQILSVVSAEQLRRMFARRTNFDLRRLLSGAEPFLYSLLGRLEWDLAMSTSSLHCLKLDPILRMNVANMLVPTSKIRDILYVILVAQERVVTLVRPKKHSIHPSDLHILINTVHAPSILNSSAAASWLPVCLPKYNPAAFVNAYVMFLRRLGDGSSNSPSTEEGGSGKPAGKEAQIGLVCVSGSADFEAVRAWCDVVSERLERDGLLGSITSAISEGTTEYTVADLGVPGLRHFVYKSRAHVQVTMPLFEDPYDDENDKRRLTTLYQKLHDAIHGKSGQANTLKLQYILTERESVMGWITQPFELYMALSPRLPKTAVVGAANAVARWVQKEEKRLFLRDAPVF